MTKETHHTSFDFVCNSIKYFAQLKYKELNKNNCDLLLLNLDSGEEINLKVNESYINAEYRIRALVRKIILSKFDESADSSTYKKNWLKRINQVENKLKRLNENKNYDFQS